MKARLKAKLCTALIAILAVVIIIYDWNLFVALVGLIIVSVGLFLCSILIVDSLTEIFGGD